MILLNPLLLTCFAVLQLQGQCEHFLLLTTPFPLLLKPMSCRYSFEGIVRIIYGLDRSPLHCDEAVSDGPTLNPSCLPEPGAASCPFSQPEAVFRTLGVKNGGLAKDFAMLGVFVLVLRLAAYVALRLRLARRN